MSATTDAMVEAIDQLDAIANGVRVESLRWVAHYDECEGWREDGACSMAHWLSYRRGYSVKTARREVRIAHSLKMLPAITEAYAAGILCADKTDLLCTIATPEDEQQWVDIASGSTFAYVEWLVRHRRRMKRSEEARNTQERYLIKQWDSGRGGLKLRAWLPGIDGAVVDQALDRLVAGAKPDPVTDMYPPFEHRYADALVEMASSQSGEPGRATVVIHADARELNYLNGVASVEDGPPVAAEAARRLSCDGRAQFVASSANGEPIGVGRTARVVPPWLARQVRHRDKGCRFMGCGRTRGIEAHHVIHWAHGGATDLDNLVSLCPYHHRLVHEGGFRLIRDSRRRLRVVRPGGLATPLRGPSIRPDLRERVFGPAKPPRTPPGQPNRRRRSPVARL